MSQVCEYVPSGKEFYLKKVQAWNSSYRECLIFNCSSVHYILHVCVLRNIVAGMENVLLCSDVFMGSVEPHNAYATAREIYHTAFGGRFSF